MCRPAKELEFVNHGLRRPQQIPQVNPMQRTIQEILDHADELAKKFEDSDPADGTERPVSEYLLQRAALARARTE